MKVLALVAASFAAFAVSADIRVVVDPTTELGPIRLMNAVNNGPSKARSDQSRGNFAAYKAARIPFARTHDSINQATSNGHTLDISAVFPDFDADENDPGNYDFTYTDKFIATIFAAGTEPFFRLGQTIENGIKKYHTKPPKDFAKWARICEHVMAHYLEGWADGFKYEIKYWEIWNEADAQLDEDREKSCQWGGTKRQFFEFYETVAKHLKKRFPDRKIGGPALGWRTDWGQDFIAYQHRVGAPLDFFSWHVYGGGIQRMKEDSVVFRRCLDTNGFERAESILDEWNYIKDWTANYPYSVKAISNEKGGAFTAAAMCACQNRPIDMLMYYDARPGTVFNGMFDLYSFAPRQPYYAFLAWANLRDLGRQVKASIDYAVQSNEFVEVSAALGKTGTEGLLLSRFVDDNNITTPETVTVDFGRGAALGKVRAYLTDEHHLGSEFPLLPTADGTLTFSLQPDAFIYIEAEAAK